MKVMSTTTISNQSRRIEVALQNYALLRGWKLSRQFQLFTLAQGKKNAGWRQYDMDMIAAEAPMGFLDHCNYWKKDGYPVAVTSEIYGYTENLWKEAELWAKKHRLFVHVPADVESWWYPNYTKLIEITRAKP